MKNTGGSAFPVPLGQSGMSLRDWFAGMALVGLLSCNDETDEPKVGWAKGLSKIAYQYADAMISEREKE